MEDRKGSRRRAFFVVIKGLFLFWIALAGIRLIGCVMRQL
jgi:hypothetical protein